MMRFGAAHSHKCVREREMRSIFSYFIFWLISITITNLYDDIMCYYLINVSFYSHKLIILRFLTYDFIPVNLWLYCQKFTTLILWFFFFFSLRVALIHA